MMVISRLDEEERTLVSIEGASNGLPINAVNEPGLYALMLGSRNPEARARHCRSIVKRDTASVHTRPLPQECPYLLRYLKATLDSAHLTIWGKVFV